MSDKISDPLAPFRKKLTGENFDLAAFKGDYDWRAAFQEAVHGQYASLVYGEDAPGPIEHVSRVVCCVAGENDGAAWLAVVEWSGPQGKVAVMEAGCDYTGWDCQAGGSIEFYDSIPLALTDITPEQAARLGVEHPAHELPKAVAPSELHHEAWAIAT